MTERQQRLEPALGVSLAIQLAGGNASALARILGVSPQSVHEWKKKGLVPANRAKRLEQIFKVPRKRFNPEIYG